MRLFDFCFRQDLMLLSTVHVPYLDWCTHITAIISCLAGICAHPNMGFLGTDKK
jgi:hypothetical protein